MIIMENVIVLCAQKKIPFLCEEKLEIVEKWNSSSNQIKMKRQRCQTCSMN